MQGGPKIMSLRHLSDLNLLGFFIYMSAKYGKIQQILKEKGLQNKTL